MEWLYRTSFFVIYGSFFLLRKRFANQVNNDEPDRVPEESFKEAIENEGQLSVFFRTALSLGMMSCLALYLWNPKFIRLFDISLPNTVRIFGLLGSVSSLPLLYHIHRELGKYWSPDLVLKKDHQLVTTGIYKWVRHPMYTGLAAFLVGSSLLSANWVIVLPQSFTLFSILSRIGKEEKMMMERFGEAYGEYRERTGLLLPKLIHSSGE